MNIEYINVVFDKRCGENSYAVWQVAGPRKLFNHNNCALLHWDNSLDEWTDVAMSDLSAEEISERIDADDLVGEFIGTINDDFFCEWSDLDKNVVYTVELMHGIVSSPIIKLNDSIARLIN